MYNFSENMNEVDVANACDLASASAVHKSDDMNEVDAANTSDRPARARAVQKSMYT